MGRPYLRPGRLAGAALAATLGLSACVLSFRAQREFTQNFDVGSRSSVWVELPEAPTRVVQAAPGSETLSVSGTWFALGGSEKVASAHASDARLVSEDLGETLRVFPYWPEAADGLVDLESGPLVLPRRRALSLVAGYGDIEFHQLDAPLDVDLGEGSIQVLGQSADLSLLTYAGHVDVTTAVPALGQEEDADVRVDVHAFSGLGSVSVEQVGEGTVYVEAVSGDIEISLAGETNLDIYLVGSRGIEVDIPSLKVNEPTGELRQSLGDGTQAIVAFAYNGSVRLESD
jgi:hypothetical protein